MKKRTRKRDVVSLDFLTEFFKDVITSKRWFNRLAKEKGFPRLARGKYDFRACARWLVKYYHDMAEESRKEGQSIQRSEERKAQYQADMLEIRLLKERGSVISVDDAVDAVEPVLSGIRSILMGIPKHAARELANKEIEPYLVNFIRKCLEELSSVPDRIGRTRKLPTAAPPIDQDLQAAAAPDGKPVGGPLPDALARGKRGKRPVGDKQS